MLGMCLFWAYYRQTGDCTTTAMRRPPEFRQWTRLDYHCGRLPAMDNYRGA